MKNKITSFKAFDLDLKCRGFQFEVGKEYSQTGNISTCNNGFHACENPFDILDFYPLVDSRFCEVEQHGKTDKEDKKVASEKITIKAEINLGGFIKACFEYINFSEKNLKITDKLKGKDKTASGDDSQLAASGDDSQLAASGDDSKLAASGHYSQLAASGDDSQLAASGDDSKLAASGHYSKLAASGHDSQLAASGHGSKLAASGHYSQLAASGHDSQLAASGPDSQLAASGHYSKLAASGHGSVIVSSGVNSKAKGCKGTLICLTHFVSNKPVKFTTGKIGEDGLKEGVFYELDSDGEFVECA